MKRTLFIITIVFVTCGVLQGTIYYVAPTGISTNTGTSINNPITFQRAGDIAMPGDIVYVRSGDYYPPVNNTYTPIMKFTRLGGSASGGYIKFIKYPKDAADAILHPYIGDGSPTGSGSWTLIKVYSIDPNVIPQYLHFEGLVFKGNADQINPSLEDLEHQPGTYCYDANQDGLVNDGCNWSCPDTDNDHVPDGCEWPRYNGQGLLVTGPFAWDPDIRTLVNRQIFDANGTATDMAGLNNYAIPHHITVKNCSFTDFPGAGLSFQRTDYITVDGCTVANNCWYTIFGSSGINFYQFVPSNYQNPQYNNSEYRNFITNNVVYGNTLKVSNQNLVVRYDGNGMIVDDFYHAQDYDPRNKTTFPNRGNIKYGPYQGRTLVSNNVIFGNGGSGLKVYSSQYVDVFHNTLFNNGLGNYRYFRTDSQKDRTMVNWLSRQASLYVQSIVDETSEANPMPIVAQGYHRIYNNVTYNTIDYPLEYTAQTLEYDIAQGPLDGNMASNNIHGIDPQYTDISGTNIALGIPNKVQAPTGLFTLKSSSAAINAGTKLWDGGAATQYCIGYDRVWFSRDAMPDAGAYEVVSSCVKKITVGSNYPISPVGIKTSFTDADRTLYQCLQSIEIKDVFDIKPGYGGVFVAEVIKTCNNTSSPPAAARWVSDDASATTFESESNVIGSLVYPNPVTGDFLYLTIPAHEFKIFNSNGALLTQGTDTNQVSITGLLQGLYIIRTDGVGHPFIIE